MGYNTKFNFRSKVIKLIAEGYSNKEIEKKIGCSRGYPGSVRRQLDSMAFEERKALEAEAAAKEAADHPEEKKDVGFRTPTMLARGRYVRSGY